MKEKDIFEKFNKWFSMQEKSGNIILNKPLVDYCNDFKVFLKSKNPIVEPEINFNVVDTAKYNFTDSQEKAFRMFLDGCNMFITGKGGTGKSYLTRQIIDYCYENDKEIIVCAPTGVAAQNIEGATLHSTFRIKSQIVEPNSLCKDKGKLNIIKKCDIILIDEISMCRIDVFTYVCNTIMSLEGKMPQIVVVGDFYQLPPVLTSKDKEIWKDIPEYNDKLFPFESPYWNTLNFKTIELTQQMRQTELDYINCLDDIRQGIPNFSCFKENQNFDDSAITLCTTNSRASEINQEKLQNLIKSGAKTMTYKSNETGIIKDSDRQTDAELTLCVGARVVFIVNDSLERYSNGEMGTVKEVFRNSVAIQTDKGRNVIIEAHEWSIHEYKLERDENNEMKIALTKVGSFSQIPLKLAWAVTVHKSQGQTYDKVNIVPNNFFADGQMYVALSRCKTLDGTHIVGEFNARQLACNNKVKEFMDNYKLV